MRGIDYSNTLLRALFLSCGVSQAMSYSVAETNSADSLARAKHQERGGLQQYLGSIADASCNLFTKKLQGDKLCPSYGESQWTGSITVGEGQALFYWFFDSRNDPKNDPVIISMAGGPGASSLLNMLRGTGPCALDEGATKPKPNPWSWNNNASLLFIDQPTGTGFSKPLDGAPLPNTEQETAQDFQRFLNVFFKQAFPEKRHLPIHISTGSYGGHYGPVYLHHILQSRRNGSEEAFWGNIETLILPDAVIDWTGPFLGVYTLLCEDAEERFRLNATACKSIAKSLAEQQRRGHACEAVYLGEECQAAYDYGTKNIFGPYMDQRRDLANIARKCPDDAEYPFCRQPAVELVEGYLNQEWLKKEVGLPSDYHFRDINTEIWQAFHDSGAWYSPTTKELIDVLDAHAEEKKVGDIKLLVLNGNLDFMVNTPGTMWQYEQLRWRGQSEYQSRQFQPLPKGLAATGSWKATDDGRLAFVAIDDAGHFMPESAREGYSRIVDKWLQGGWRGQ